MGTGFAKSVQSAEQAEALVLVLGDRSGLTPDCSTGEFRDCATLRLPGVQAELAQSILATGKPLVLVLVNGRPYAIPGLDQQANAILEAWLSGEEGGAAVAEVLFGQANPGGKLPVSFPRHVGSEDIRQACEDSLRRLYTGYIDQYQFHDNGYPAHQAAPVRETLEELVKEGKIRAYGWSPGFTDRAKVFAQGPNCTAIQLKLNILDG